jgi:hypothetical protein
LFQDLDATIAELLKRELPADLVSQITIAFATPDATFPPNYITLPAINLFLVGIQENLELRRMGHNTEHVKSDGRVVAKRAPRRIDCLYMVTAWATSTVSRPEQDEHRMLGEAVRVLLRHVELPAEVLQGDLKNQPYPVRTKIMATPERGRAEYWQALGGRPRTIFDYTVTLSVDIEEPILVGSIVTSLGTQGS